MPFQEGSKSNNLENSSENSETKPEALGPVEIVASELDAMAGREGLDALLAAELKKMAENLRIGIQAERDKVLQEIAGAAAHEINQPLTVGIGYLQLLDDEIKKSGLAGEMSEFTQEVSGQMAKISEIVRRIGQANSYKNKPYVGDIRIADFDLPKTRAQSGEGK